MLLGDFGNAQKIRSRGERPRDLFSRVVELLLRAGGARV